MTKHSAFLSSLVPNEFSREMVAEIKQRYFAQQIARTMPARIGRWSPQQRHPPRQPPLEPGPPSKTFEMQ
eukprot:gene29620-38743_t